MLEDSHPSSAVSNVELRKATAHFNSDGSRRKGTIPPTPLRPMADFQGHNRPQNGLDNTGQPWLGASRVVDGAKRRRTNRNSWRKLKAAARRNDQLVKGIVDAEAES